MTTTIHTIDANLMQLQMEYTSIVNRVSEISKLEDNELLELAYKELNNFEENYPEVILLNTNSRLDYD